MLTKKVQLTAAFDIKKKSISAPVNETSQYAESIDEKTNGKKNNPFIPLSDRPVKYRVFHMSNKDNNN